MLEITIPAKAESEFWDEGNEEFIYIPAEKEQTLQLEHSLISISKWESRWHKPFFSREEKTTEELIDYICCMSLTRNVNPSVYRRLENDKNNIDKIIAYMEDPMTATTFSNSNKKGGREIITSEVIYYWMFANGIPKECEQWHISRLITLIRVFGEKGGSDKKYNKKETMSRYAALNAARRKKLNTKG